MMGALRTTEMGTQETKWLDVTGWTVETVHDVLKRNRAEGWELESVTRADAQRIVFRLVRMRGAAQTT